ncbi:hypothetical protein VTH06DRAFT_4858 [Thermothelomyces fergusii]
MHVYLRFKITIYTNYSPSKERLPALVKPVKTKPPALLSRHLEGYQSPFSFPLVIVLSDPGNAAAGFQPEPSDRATGRHHNRPEKKNNSSLLPRAACRTS